ncbi:MAG: sigma-70 family RNA polymerase sigma factor, partial [Planctomycetaceae bacterium]|nr:sigma-70 family RNA polymerase sigma factor [Planctomycetaceae bacterium]
MHTILKTENSSAMSISFNACADSELVYRVRLGETGAFDEIDNRYRGVLYRFLLRFTFNAELAEELTQRVLVRAFEMIDQLKSGDKLVGWLHRIAFRLAVSEVRCKKGVSLDELDEPFTCPVNQIDVEDEKRNLWNCAKKHLSQD